MFTRQEPSASQECHSQEGSHKRLSSSTASRPEEGASQRVPLPFERAMTLNLAALPVDVQHCVLCRLSPHEVARLGATCRALASAVSSEALWREVIMHSFGPVVQLAFDGECPAPLPTQTWREHCFDFERTWMLRAKTERARAFVQLSGRVYDATDYLEDHPGSPAFIWSAAGTDATAVFALAGHSDDARHQLLRFHVPPLDRFALGRRGERQRRRHSASTDSAMAENIAPTAAALAAAAPASTVAGGIPLPTESAASAGTGASTACAVVYALLRSPHGRSRLLHAFTNLAAAAITDLDRMARAKAVDDARDEVHDEVHDEMEPPPQLARDPAPDAPRREGAASDAPPSHEQSHEQSSRLARGAGFGIQRLLPVMWRLMCAELWSCYCMSETQRAMPHSRVAYYAHPHAAAR